MPSGIAEAGVTVVLLAGGEATRLPGKLERTDAGDPLIVGAYERFAPFYPVVVSASATFAPAIDARLACPIVVDRWSRRGPLAGILSALAAVRTPLICAVAADLPEVDADLVRALREAFHPDVDAVVPVHERGVEPLCALYDRAAFERAGLPVLTRGTGAVRDALAGLRVATLAVPSHRFANVNTHADWARAFA
ncbi:MAG TPA: molybdenum cofactor guanylyltransferase [Candidatus Baltobacteraceae bacterium]|jgi:molybdopterin-guanine dinucleotide biosynthesis protein A